MRTEDQLRTAHEALREVRLTDYVVAIRAIADLAEREAVWTALGKEHGKSLDLIGLLEAWPQEDKSSAFRFLAPAVAHARALTVSEVLSLVQLAASVPQADGYYLHKVLVEVFKSAPPLAAKVGDRLREDAISASDQRWELWARAFSQADAPAAAKYVLELRIATPDERLRLALLVERLQVADSIVEQSLRPRADEFAQALLLEAPTAGTQFSAHWSALCRLAEVSSLAMEAVLAAARRGERPALVALANWLRGRASDEVGACHTPLTQLVDLLLEKSLADDELPTQAVDGTVQSLLYNQNLRQLILPCLERLGAVGAPVAEVFTEAFSALSDFPGAPERLLTAWLVRKDASFSAIQSMLHRFAGPHGAIGLDAATFMGAPLERQEAALKRLLVLTMDGAILCSFVALLAESPNFQPVGLPFARRLLNDVFIEYPSATEEFLNARSKDLDPKAPYASMYQSVGQNVDRWKRVLEELPRLKELKPSETEWLAIRALAIRFSRDVNRRAEQESILGQLFAKKVHIAQGRKSTSLFGPGAMQVIRFGEFSQSVEFPSSHVSDPLGAEIRRKTILAASR